MYKNLLPVVNNTAISKVTTFVFRRDYTIVYFYERTSYKVNCTMCQFDCHQFVTISIKRNVNRFTSSEREH